jgi:hypothetical protein
MHLPHRAGFPGDCLNPAGLKMRPPRPPNGAAQILQRGGDGIRRNTRRWLARPALSPVSTARTCSRVNASPAIYSIYRHKHRQHLFAHRRPPLTAPGNAAGRAVSDRSRVGRFSSRPLTGQSGVRPDAYADCSQDRAGSRSGQHRNRWNQKRPGGCDRPRSRFWTVVLAHHLGHGHWLSRVPVWVRRLQLRRRTRAYGTRTRVAVGPQTSRGKV